MYFERYIKLSAECAARRAPYESPKLHALAVAAPPELGPGGVPLLDYDPKEKLKQVVTAIINAKRAAEAENAIDGTPTVTNGGGESSAPEPDDDDPADGELVR